MNAKQEQLSFTLADPESVRVVIQTLFDQQAQLQTDVQALSVLAGALIAMLVRLGDVKAEVGALVTQTIDDLERATGGPINALAYVRSIMEAIGREPPPEGGGTHLCVVAKAA